MPLIKGGSSSAISANIRELHSGNTYAKTSAKYGKDKANKQAIAIAMRTAGKTKPKKMGRKSTRNTILER